MGPPHSSSEFPASLPPAAGAETASIFDEEQPSESCRLAVSPTMVALAVADRTLRDSLSVLLQSAGRLPGGDDIIPVAAVIIVDAIGGAKHAVAQIRARARTDAAIIVVLAESAPASDVGVAYEAGAVLCLRVPVDEHPLLAAVGSAIDLHTAKSTPTTWCDSSTCRPIWPRSDESPRALPTRWATRWLCSARTLRQSATTWTGFFKHGISLPIRR